jgi:hypothetical protein
MKIENQVLSIEQVQELQELGFDVEKYASMCWVAYTSDEEPYEKEYRLSIFDEFCYESASLEPIPTMTIGDIIDVLPKEIEKDNEKYSLYIAYRRGSIAIFYDIINDIGTLQLIVIRDLIYGLFEMLKWCIKEKHIKL